MPCNSDYLSASEYEIELSRVACLLDEIAGKKKLDRSHWRGYHPRVYNKPFSRGDRGEGDVMVAELCAFLRSAPDITIYSLEMQIWWRDHKKADKKAGR